MSEPTNLLDVLFRLRDDQRKVRSEGRMVVQGASLPWETNTHGEMKWYMHPSLPRVANNFLFFAQRISPGASTGRLHHPGGQLIFVQAGTGRTILDDEEISWGEEDLILLPLRRGGVVVQHFNDGAGTAILLCCEPNLVDPLGVDRGGRFEQLDRA